MRLLLGKGWPSIGEIVCKGMDGSYYIPGINLFKLFNTYEREYVFNKKYYFIMCEEILGHWIKNNAIGKKFGAP